jgi:hypothetical protein
MSITVIPGIAYEKIVHFAEENNADIIMIGHRGMSNRKKFFLGSVAAKVVPPRPLQRLRPPAEGTALAVQKKGLPAGSPFFFHPRRKPSPRNPTWSGQAWPRSPA